MWMLKIEPALPSALFFHLFRVSTVPLKSTGAVFVHAKCPYLTQPMCRTSERAAFITQFSYSD